VLKSCWHCGYSRSIAACAGIERSLLLRSGPVRTSQQPGPREYRFYAAGSRRGAVLTNARACERSSVGAVRLCSAGMVAPPTARSMGHLCIDDDGCHTSTFARAVSEFPVDSRPYSASQPEVGKVVLAGCVQ